jgi:hypothetical protein
MDESKKKAKQFINDKKKEILLNDLSDDNLEEQILELQKKLNQGNKTTIDYLRQMRDDLLKKLKEKEKLSQTGE